MTQFTADSIPPASQIFGIGHAMLLRIAGMRKGGGIVVIGGMTGQGKSTTMAAIGRYLKETTEATTVYAGRSQDIPELVSDWSQINPLAARGIERRGPSLAIMFDDICDSATAVEACILARVGAVVLVTIHAASLETTSARFYSLMPNGAELYCPPHTVPTIAIYQRMRDCGKNVLSPIVSVAVIH